MANDGSVIIDIEGDSSKFKSALSGLGSIASTALKGVTTAVAAVTTAVAGVATAAVKVGSGFESSMSQVAATMGLTVEDIRNGSEEFELLSQAAKDAGATTAFSASEAADALNYLALAGYDAATSADVLPSVLNLAAAGGLDLAYASDLATDAMAALGIEASSANLTEFGDKMAKTASKANTSVGQLGEAILTVGGTAKSLAGGTTELNAALGVLANRGIKGAEGGTALRNVILALSAPTDKAADAMSALGLEVYDAAGNMRPLNEVFRDLDSALSGMTEGEKTKVLNEIFNKVDLKSAQALLAGCGEEFDNLAAAIDDSAGAMQNMADTQLDNLQGDITIMKSALEGLGIGVYENLQAPLRDTVQFATELVGQLSEALNENGLEGLVSAAGDVLSEVLLMGFNHDTLTSSTAYGSATATGKAGMTLQMADCLAATAKMNSSNTNSGGWESCAMRTSNMATYLSQLTSAWQSVVKQVNKLSSAGSQSTTIKTTADKLFLLSEVEIFGSATYSVSGEGSQYAYYKAGNSKVKNVNGSAHHWWERSPYASNTTYFCRVNSSGGAYYYYASGSFGVAFGFCV